MANSLKLEVLLDAVDKATAPLKRIDRSAKEAARTMRDTQRSIKELNREQSDVTAYRRAEVAIKRNERAMNALRERSQQVAQAHDQAKAKQRDLQAEMTAARRQYTLLSQSMMNAGGKSSALSAELEKSRLRMEALSRSQAAAREEVRRYGRQVSTVGEQESRLRTRTDEARRTVEVLGQRFKEAGVDMSRMGNVARGLNQRESQLNSTLKTQKERLAQIKTEQDRVSAARERYDRTMHMRNNLAVTGAGAAVVGGGVVHSGYQTIDAAKHADIEKNRLASLGIGQAETDRLVKYASEMQGFGTSQVERVELMRDAMSVFGDAHHAIEVMPVLAKMKFANKALYGDQGAEDMERKFLDMLKVIELRGGLNDPKEFAKQANMIQQVITATGGRVDATEYMNMINTGGLAAKGIEDKSFYYELEPIVQEIGGHRTGTSLMSGYQNLYQGKTTKAAAKKMASLGLIGDKDAVTYDKAGQNAYLGPGALLQGDLFLKNQVEWVRSVLMPQLAKNGITSERDVLSAIGSIISNRTASNLYGTFVQQINNGSMKRRMDINEHAENIDQAETRGRGTAQGRELEALSRRNDLMQKLGTQLMPIYLDILEKVNGALEKMSEFVDKHPGLAKAAIYAFMGFGVLIGLFGGLSLALSALSGPLAVVRLGFALLNRTMMLNPIIAIITAIAVAALLIYIYWEPIKKKLEEWGVDVDGFGDKLAAVWEKIKTAFEGGLGSILLLILQFSPVGMIAYAFKAVLDYLGIELPDWLVSAGENLQQRFIAALSWENVSNYVKGIIKEFKDGFNGGLTGIAELIVNWSFAGSLWRMLAKVLQFFGVDVPDKLTDAGKAMITALVTGITDAWQWGMKKLTDIGDWISSKFSWISGQTNVSVSAPAMPAGAQGVSGGQQSFQPGAGIRATSGPGIQRTAPASGGDTYHVALHGVDMNSKQDVYSMVRRALEDAKNQSRARERSGVADRY